MALDATTALTRALVASAAIAGASVAVVDDAFVRWSSATFVGGRHMLKVEGVRCDALDTWLSALPSIEIVVSGHLVADLVVTTRSSSGGLTEAHLEALTVAMA